MAVCKLCLLFISADAAKEKEKRKESAAARWCFKVCSPYSNIVLLLLHQAISQNPTDFYVSILLAHSG
jgi:hypothetical protein